jgi:hypothetical protein
MWQTVNISTPEPHKRYLFYDDQAGQEFEDYGNTVKSYTYYKEIW